MNASRAAIADACGKVEPLHASVLRPVTLSPYDAWPVWTGSTPQTTGCTFLEHEWDVYVALPALAAVEAGDELAHQIALTLEQVGAVTRFEPIQIVGSDGGDPMPALRYQLRTT